LIPKKIHYCWFGNKPKSNFFKQCLESWQQYCPDFEIIEWNETNSKPYQNKFYKNALRKKKYAFVADCIRSKVLYELGGVYMDTDMLLLKPIENLLSYNFFTGFEVETRPAFGLFGAIKKHPLLKEMVVFYDTHEFNEFSLPVITHTFKELFAIKNLNEKEVILDVEYFYSLPYQKKEEDYKNYCTSKSYAVHLWDHSWNEVNTQTTMFYIIGIKKVLIDYLFYDYSRAYFIRYIRGFSRQIYYLLSGKK